MPYLLRKISKVKWQTDDKPWIINGEFAADCIIDLKTENNELSFWIVEDNQSNLTRILAAIGTVFEIKSQLEYALVDLSVLSNFHIKSLKTPGNSHDEYVNNTWHLDLVELTAQTVLKIAKEIFIHEKPRILWNDVKDLIKLGIENGQIDKSKIKPEIKGKLT